MKLGPKFKIARRLGAPIFEKTQTAKFKEATGGKPKRGGMMKSDYGRQMIEKQKARFTYGISEKQFSKYVKTILEAKSSTPAAKIYEALETRLDNVTAKLGLSSTRRFGRQLVSHGHIKVNGTRVKVPSFRVKPNDVISVREGSLTSGPFKDLDKKLKEITVPGWLNWDIEKKEATVLRLPTMEGQELLFDLNAVIEFYKR